MIRWVVLALLLLFMALVVFRPLRWGRSVKVQVVVARYAEDLEWLKEPPFDRFDDVVVYNKGPTPFESDSARVVKLPNVGREGHTYLTHILRNWDNLADVTVFVMGSCRATSEKWARATWVAKHVAATGSSAFPDHPLPAPLHEARGTFVISSYRSTHPTNATINPESKLLPSPHRPFGTWMGANQLSGVDGVTYSGCFAVAREHIRQHPKARYERLLQYLDHHSNPEAGHYLERAWLAVFHPVPEECRKSTW